MEKESNMTQYVLRACGVSYLFQNWTDLVDQVAFLGISDYEVDYADASPTAKTVRNLMSGETLEIAIDTPISCDPSSETYWAM